MAGEVAGEVMLRNSSYSPMSQVFSKFFRSHSLIKTNIKEVLTLIEDGTVQDGMLPKVLTCISALEMEQSAHIIDGRINTAYSLEIFTKQVSAP